MLNDNIKSLITTTIALYNSEKITQNIIEEGLLKLKEAVRLIKEQQEVTPIEKITTPVTLEELESKFPIEPEYPELQLRDDYNLEVNLKADLLTLDVREGTIVKTKGYYTINDGGQAIYEIMSYDNWWNQLPLDLKLVTYHNDRLGVAPVFYKNPVDNFGNHKLKNGMVAKLLPNLDGYVRTEQWGLFEGRYDNCRALVHCFANNTRDCKILFPKNKNYTFYDSRVTEVRDRKAEIFFNLPSWLKSVCGNGNEYALVHGTRRTASPVIGNARNLEICGNGSTLRWGDGQVNEAFGLIECGGFMDGLKIHGLDLDGNFKEQLYQKDKNGNKTTKKQINPSTGKEYETYQMVLTRAHGISYFSTGFNCSSVTSDGYIKDGNDKNTGIKLKYLQNYLGVEDTNKTTFNNVEIYGCTIKNVGTKIVQSDSGGDCILIINPIECNNVNVHNNKFLNWGRWVHAIDLGGNGERFYNHSFIQNICIQDEENYSGWVEDNGIKHDYRGLGWIDFEARKCFTNLDVSENYVYGANGWAFNGNGKISENIKIENNNITRPSYKWTSIYPYAFTFYSVHPKDLSIKNNHIKGGSIDFGRTWYNVVLENNELGATIIPIRTPFGNVSIKNNTGTGVRNQLWGISASNELPGHITDKTSPFYVAEEDYVANLVMENNAPEGICGDIIIENPSAYIKSLSLVFKNNKFNKFNVNCHGIKEFYFTVDQLNPKIIWSARGCKTYNKVYSVDSYRPVPGGLYYKEGDLITDTVKNLSNIKSEYFTKLFPIGSTYKNGDMYCIQEGVFPVQGEFLYCENDYLFNANSKATKGRFYYTVDNLYYALNSGTFGNTEPTHTEGVELNGDVKLLRISPIARYEMRNK